MSKAFTKETDDAPEDEGVALPPSASLPPGTKNYLTASGAHQFRAELEMLVQREQTTGTAKDNLFDEARTQHRKVKRRIAEIEQILRSAEVVAPPVGTDARDEVVFGASVTVREVRSKEESRYRIVGVDEVDLGEDQVSLYAPVARALLNAQVGERVRFRFPPERSFLKSWR